MILVSYRQCYTVTHRRRFLISPSSILRRSSPVRARELEEDLVGTGYLLSFSGRQQPLIHDDDLE